MTGNTVCSVLKWVNVYENLWCIWEATSWSTADIIPKRKWLTDCLYLRWWIREETTFFSNKNLWVFIENDRLFQIHLFWFPGVFQERLLPSKGEVPFWFCYINIKTQLWEIFHLFTWADGSRRKEQVSYFNILPFRAFPDNLKGYWKWKS